jgi:flagellar hook-associated protein 1 FlgK
MASQSLQTQQTAVQVTGQNLANVNTTGYTRQTADIETSPDVMVTGIGLEGTGAQVLTIQQAVDAVLNNQIQGQQSVNGYWNAQQSALQSVQDNLNEFLSTSNSAATNTSTSTTTSSGLSTLLNNFFGDLQSVATSPTSIPARQSLISDAQTLATTFNQMSSQFGQQDTTLNTRLSNNVDSANQLLSDIAGLNQQISAAEFGGGDANDLVNKQQQDLQNLAQLTDITTSAGANGQVNVSIDGQQLISGDKLLDTLQTYDPGNGNLLVETATGGTPLTLTGGSMQGTIDTRDGTLATLQNSVNTLASTLITQFNSIYTTGFSITGTTGAVFFNGSDATSITVNPTVVNDPSSFQASGSATASGDNSIALQLADLANTAQSGLGGQTFTGSYTQTVGNFGNTLQNANTQVTNQTAVMNMLTTQQQTISGVSIDEEMTHLLTFQQAYEASAELVSTVNQMLGATLAMKSGS